MRIVHWVAHASACAHTCMHGDHESCRHKHAKTEAAESHRHTHTRTPWHLQKHTHPRTHDGCTCVGALLQADNPQEPGPVHIKTFHDDIHEEVERIQRMPAAVTALEMALGLSTPAGPLHETRAANTCVCQQPGFVNPHPANHVHGDGLANGGAATGM